MNMEAVTMDAATNKKIVKDTWDAFWRGDIEAGVANMSDDIAWFTPGANAMAGWKRGKDAIRQFRFNELGVFRELKRDVIGIYGDGDTVIMEVKATGRLNNGEPYDNAGCVVWVLENGKIKQVRQYVDTQKAMAISALFKDGKLKAAQQ
jgi:ketosteroid isomerase-like protein